MDCHGNTNAGGVPVVVAAPKNTPNSIDLQTGVKIDENTRREFAALSGFERQNFLWELRFGLLRFGVGFAGVNEPLEDIGLMQRICDDGLTKDVFVQRNMQLRSAALFVIWSFGRKFENNIQTYTGNLTIH